MNRKQREALVLLAAALAVGAVIQAIAQQEAAVLGVSALELALLGGAAGALARRIA
jgi:hypothetical protein